MSNFTTIFFIVFGISEAIYRGEFIWILIFVPLPFLYQFISDWIYNYKEKKKAFTEKDIGKCFHNNKD